MNTNDRFQDFGDFSDQFDLFGQNQQADHENMQQENDHSKTHSDFNNSQFKDFQSTEEESNQQLNQDNCQNNKKLLKKTIYKKKYENLIDNGQVYDYDKDPEEYKKARKRIQNRLSASRVRNRKKNHTEILEEKVEFLQEQNNQLQLRNMKLQSENDILKKQVQMFEKILLKQENQSQNGQIKNQKNDPSQQIQQKQKYFQKQVKSIYEPKELCFNNSQEEEENNESSENNNNINNNNDINNSNNFSIEAGFERHNSNNFFPFFGDQKNNSANMFFVASLAVMAFFLIVGDLTVSNQQNNGLINAIQIIKSQQQNYNSTDYEGQGQGQGQDILGKQIQDTLNQQLAIQIQSLIEDNSKLSIYKYLLIFSLVGVYSYFLGKLIYKKVQNNKNLQKFFNNQFKAYKQKNQ